MGFDAVPETASFIFFRTNNSLVNRIDTIYNIQKWRCNMNYFEHLVANWKVAGHALWDFYAHFVHGLFPFIKVKHHQPKVEVEITKIKFDVTEK